MSSQNNRFSSMLEQVLLNIWGVNRNRLDKRHLIQTRKALSSIRAIYRFKGERGLQQPSRVNYSIKRNSAGCSASFFCRLSSSWIYTEDYAYSLLVILNMDLLSNGWKSHISAVRYLSWRPTPPESPCALGHTLVTNVNGAPATSTN